MTTKEAQQYLIDWKEYLGCHWSIVCSNEENLDKFIETLLEARDIVTRHDTRKECADAVKTLSINQEHLAECNSWTEGFECCFAGKDVQDAILSDNQPPNDE